MTNDEREIRQLVASWMAATRSGDTASVLDLMTDDVVFLIAGRPEPMNKAAFEAAARAQQGGRAPQFEGQSEIKELQVLGDWAFMWTQLTVTATPPGGGKPMKRAGHTLTILRKENGRWRLARDANLLTPVPGQ
jgi:uncharacterized protein (TIGR02246 family)